MKFKFLFPRFTNKEEDGGAWCESWREISIKFNTQIIYTVDDEKDWTFTLQLLGFGFTLFSSIWSFND